MSTGGGTYKVMLLVDADNVSADVMEQAVRGVLAEHGHLHVRRAYCTPEVALKHQQLFKRLSMRPMVNLAAGKNSTDIALAVDAMDLAMAERPHCIYLVSSDSDFTPLVSRLREKGCRVCGIGQQGKTSDETMAAYDHFVDLRHKGGGAPPAAEPPAPQAGRAPARKAAARKTAAAAPAPAPAKKTARKTAARTAAAPATEAILAAVPALRRGAEIPLNDAVQALRAARLLGRNASSLRFFEKLEADFALMHHPDRIRWKGAAAA